MTTAHELLEFFTETTAGMREHLAKPPDNVLWHHTVQERFAPHKPRLWARYQAIGAFELGGEQQDPRMKKLSDASFEFVWCQTLRVFSCMHEQTARVLEADLVRFVTAGCDERALTYEAVLRHGLNNMRELWDLGEINPGFLPHCRQHLRALAADGELLVTARKLIADHIKLPFEASRCQQN